MVNQFVNAVGCSPDQASQILQSAQWHLEAALSLFFQDHSIGVSHGTQHTLTPGSSGGSSLGIMSYTCVPTNTPATPPSFPDTLDAFSQMKASSPGDHSDIFQEPRMVPISKN